MLIQKCKFFVVLFFVFITSRALGQNAVDVKMIFPDKEYENVFIKKLYSDTNSTSFMIWVKNEVQSHKHLVHTETIQILEGTAEMIVGKETFIIKTGDFFVIPPNTFHRVKVISTTPLKLISIQSPNFNGEDRIFEEKQQ